MSDASDLQIKFPVKSSGIPPSLVLHRRRESDKTAAVDARTTPPPLPGSVAETVAATIPDVQKKDEERVLREFENRLNDRERVTVELEKRLAQREHDLVQAETALQNAVDALQKIKSAIHARRD